MLPTADAASATGWRAGVTAAFDALVTALNAIGTAWIFVIMVAINADVFSRFLFNAPIAGVPLVIEMSIIAIVFLQLTAALRGGRLTRSDVLIARLLRARPQLGFSLQAVYHATGAVLMTILFVFSGPFLEKAWRRDTYAGLEGDFTLPVWPLKALILLGAAICAIQFARHVGIDARTLRGMLRRERLESGAVVIPVLGTAAVAFIFYAMGTILELNALQVGLISVFFVLFLVYIGVHVGVALASLSFVCVWVIRDPVIAGKLLALAAAQSLQRYEFGVIPLFVFMGLLVSVSDIGKDTYDVANHLFRRVKAGLGMATVGANAVFAAVTGTSIASASVFTKVAVPEMLRLGYKPRFAVGVVAGSSVLGMLIPPSLLLILYGILSETSIGDLFIAGIIPGIVLSIAYCGLIWIMARRYPDHVATPEALSRHVESDMGAVEMAAKSIPIVALIIVVLGGIYGGVFTATEAGGVGAMGALLLTIAKRRLTWARLWTALTETGHVTAAICFLLISAHLYARMITMTGIPDVMEAYVVGSGLGMFGLIAIYLIAVIILGTILDAGSIMLITVPLAVPALAAFNVDLIWFGIITIIAVEIGLLTPPLGLACFVIHNNLRDERISIEDIFWGAAPFALTMLVVLILVTLIPELATMLL
jgi:tripartite ATP-independent transporter DctM subunit